jgi:hypothetical protein
VVANRIIRTQVVRFLNISFIFTPEFVTILNAGANVATDCVLEDTSLIGTGLYSPSCLDRFSLPFTLLSDGSRGPSIDGKAVGA